MTETPTEGETTRQGPPQAVRELISEFRRDVSAGCHEREAEAALARFYELDPLRCHPDELDVMGEHRPRLGEKLFVRRCLRNLRAELINQAAAAFGPALLKHEATQ